MSRLSVKPLGDQYSFGSVVNGLTMSMLLDEDVREELKALFEDRGMILFRESEDTPELQLAVSQLFGPLKVFPVGSVLRVEGEDRLVDLRQEPEDAPTVEIEGKIETEWLPWHFDHCFLGELNRGGVLRPVKIARDGGETGFLDGIDAYQRMRPDLRAKLENVRVIYKAEYEFDLKFWKPKGFKMLHMSAYNRQVGRDLKNAPRAIHPAVFTHPNNGRKVLHLSAWWAEGIEGHEDAEGDALLTEAMHAMIDEGNPYIHKWRHGDMIAWDNWRLMHMVTGHPKEQPRQMHRSTIQGDYGLGGLEPGGAGARRFEPAM